MTTEATTNDQPVQHHEFLIYDPAQRAMGPHLIRRPTAPQDEIADTDFVTVKCPVDNLPSDLCVLVLPSELYNYDNCVNTIFPNSVFSGEGGVDMMFLLARLPDHYSATNELSMLMDDSIDAAITELRDKVEGAEEVNAISESVLRYVDHDLAGVIDFRVPYVFVTLVTHSEGRIPDSYRVDPRICRYTDTYRYDIRSNGYHSDYDNDMVFEDEELRDSHDLEHENNYGDEEGEGVEFVQRYHSASVPFREVMGADDAAYRVGFEVEKVSINGADNDGEHVGPYPTESGFFAYVMSDSSCGVEAVTNVLPLEVGHAEVHASIEGVAELFEEEDNKDCSCHANLSMRSKDGGELAKAMIPYMGIIYSLWLPRLFSQYVVGDQHNGTVAMRSIKDGRGFDSSKYSPLVQKRGYVELRIPNAVRSAASMIARYDFFAEWMHCIEDEAAFDEMIERVRPYVESMYSRTENGGAIALARLSDAKHMQQLIDSDAQFREYARFRKMRRLMDRRLVCNEPTADEIDKAYRYNERADQLAALADQGDQREWLIEQARLIAEASGNIIDQREAEAETEAPTAGDREYTIRRNFTNTPIDNVPLAEYGNLAS